MKRKQSHDCEIGLVKKFRVKCVGGKS